VNWSLGGSVCCAALDSPVLVLRPHRSALSATHQWADRRTSRLQILRTVLHVLPGLSVARIEIHTSRVCMLEIAWRRCGEAAASQRPDICSNRPHLSTHNSLHTVYRLLYDRSLATVSLGNIWKHIYLGPRNRSALWLSIIVHYTNTLTYTYLLTYKLQSAGDAAWRSHVQPFRAFETVIGTSVRSNLAKGRIVAGYPLLHYCIVYFRGLRT